MEKYLKKMTEISTLTSIVFILVGLFLLIKPETTLSILAYIVGIIILINGIMNLVRYFMNREVGYLFDFGLIIGVFSVSLSIIFIANPAIVVSIIPLVLGIWILVNGIIKLQLSVNLKNYPNSGWIRSLVISVLSIILGIILVFNPFGGAVVMTKIIGIFLIVYSILDLFESRTIRKTLEDGVEFIK